MKKKAIISTIIILLLLTIVLVFLPKKEEQNSPTPINDETIIPINWKELIEVEAHGTEDDNYISITYVKEIPYLKEKIRSEFEKWENSTNRSEEGLERLTNIQNLENTFDFCRTKEEYKHLEKDSEFIVVCESQLLEELGYAFDKEITYKASGIQAPIKQEENKEPEEVKSTEQLIYEQSRALEPVYGAYAAGDLLWVDVYNINGFKLDDEKSVQYKHTLLHVIFEEDLDKTLEYARSNPNVDFVKYGDFAYTKEKNFEGGRAWYGVPIY